MADPRIPQWRASCLDGTITVEDYKQALASLREGREAAQQSTKKPKSTKRVKKLPLDASNQLDLLKGLM